MIHDSARLARQQGEESVLGKSELDLSSPLQHRPAAEIDHHVVEADDRDGDGVRVGAAEHGPDGASSSSPPNGLAR